MAQWVTAADYLASALHTGRAPKALKVLRFAPRAPQEGLRALRVGGRQDYEIDPYADDLIARLVELRAETRNRQASLGRDDPERLALEGAQQAMKVTANSVSYGAPIEVNVVSHPKPAPVTLIRPDNSRHRLRNSRTEEPGSYFHPLLATLVSGGGRLLLALAMRLVRDLGGTYVFCDTDSLFVVATEHGGTVAAKNGEGIHALSWAEVDIVVKRVKSLNPFTGVLADKSVLKVGDENFDEEGNQRELWCLAIASKRYGLATRDDAGRPVFVGSPGRRKRSEHGLGHLFPLTDPDPASSDKAWCDR